MRYIAASCYINFSSLHTPFYTEQTKFLSEWILIRMNVQMLCLHGVAHKFSHFLKPYRVIRLRWMFPERLNEYIPYYIHASIGSIIYTMADNFHRTWFATGTLFQVDVSLPGYGCTAIWVDSWASCKQKRFPDEINSSA